MLGRVSILIVGISLILIGTDMFFRQVHFNLKWGYVNYGPFHSAMGVFFVVIGSWFTVSCLRWFIKHKKKK
jgi:hypothetical protein